MEVVEQSEQNVQTEQDSTLGTFKDVQSLKTAYDNLRSEFTRKSQKLAELKKSGVGDKVNTPPKSTSDEGIVDVVETKNLSKTSVGTMHFDSKSSVKSEENNKNDENSANNQQEIQSEDKLPFWQRSTWDTQIKEFFEQFPMDTKDRKEMAKILSEDKDIEYSESPLHIAYAKMLNNKKVDIEKLIEDEDFVNKMVSNPKIKNKIINDYLGLLNKNRMTAPKVMAETKGYEIGGKQVKKPSNLVDAYNVVKKYFE